MTDAMVHPTASVAAGAELHKGVCVGAYCVIGATVTVGEGTRIGPHTFIESYTRIGKNNVIVGQASIGAPPQDLKYRGEETWVEIGDENTIREFVTINRGTAGGIGRTVIGNQNLLMTAVHIAHDCTIGDQVIMANAATLAGHVEVADYSTVGAFVGIHQFCRVGLHAFIGGYSVITRDTLPFVKTVGDRNHAKTYDINAMGLQRRGFSEHRIGVLKKAYRILIRRGLRTGEAVEQIRTLGLETEDVAILIRFIQTCERGFIR
jgi:UDP-N-acetylglucosamine acyltransferase